MKPARYLAVFALAGVALADASADTPLLPEAQRAFREGQAAQGDAAAQRHFRDAVRGYQNEIGWGTNTPPALWRVYGNSLLLTGRVPQAIHAYRRGLTLAPDDEGLRLGLQLARSRVAYATPDDGVALTPRPDRFDAVRQPLRRWGIWAVAGFGIVAWFALHRWVLTHRPRWLATFIIALAVVLLLTGGWIWDRADRQDSGSQRWGVLWQSAVLRRGDGHNFLPRRDNPLPPGVELRIIGEQPRWYQVELADGTVGWIPIVWRQHVSRSPVATSWQHVAPVSCHKLAACGYGNEPHITTR